MLEIPIVCTAPHFTQEHHLFGQRYLLEFEWIDRGQSWVLHLYDGLEQPIAFGLRLTIEWPVFVEKRKNLGLFLFARKPNSRLHLATLKTDFMLVAHEIV